jgi:lysozyme family protein
MTKDTFSVANAFTAKWEGGYVNHPKDPGGATNYGVSLRWLRGDGIDINNDGKIDIADIKALTPQKAADLFWSAFWDKLHLSLLPPLTAIVTYDASVNTGRGQAVHFLQRACNVFDNARRITDDGVLGNQTRLRINDIIRGSKNNDLSLALHTIEQRENFHNLLAANSPYSDGRDYRPFLKGWLNRTRELAKYITSIDV